MSTQPKISAGLPADPMNRGHVMGWGVYRPGPRDLFGVCTSESEANAMRGQAGDGYVVAYGSHELGTDNFVVGDSQVKASF